MPTPTRVTTQHRQLPNWLWFCVFSGSLAGLFFLQKNQTSSAKEKITTQPSTVVTTIPRPDLADPAEDYSTFLYVLESGGCEITRPVAIAWLDRSSRERRTLSSDQSARLLTMLENGGHPSWDSGFRHHLFNSALNILHQSSVAESLTRILQQFALHNPDKTMRLYAMQHLGIQRRIGQLEGLLADEIEATLHTLATRKDGEESGYALDMLTTWNDAQALPSSPAIQELALSIAADPARSLDVRVSALHASGPSSLELARKLALDTAAPMPLRKAAIARIGHHGSAQDLAALAELQKQNSRLAQAAEPAQLSIRNRNNSSPSKPRSPYQ